jgi:hypothetical protein
MRVSTGPGGRSAAEDRGRPVVAWRADRVGTHGVNPSRAHDLGRPAAADPGPAHPEVCSGGAEVLEVIQHLKHFTYVVRPEIKRRSQ